MKLCRREVAKVMRERAEVVDKWREVAVFMGSQLNLSRTRSKMGLSTPSSQEFKSHMGFNYFLLHKGAVQEWVQYYSSKKHGFHFGSSLAGQNWFLWGVVSNAFIGCKLKQISFVLVLN